MFEGTEEGDDQMDQATEKESIERRIRRPKCTFSLIRQTKSERESCSLWCNMDDHIMWLWCLANNDILNGLACRQSLVTENGVQSQVADNTPTCLPDSIRERVPNVIWALHDLNNSESLSGVRCWWVLSVWCWMVTPSPIVEQIQQEVDFFLDAVAHPVQSWCAQELWEESSSKHGGIYFTLVVSSCTGREGI